METGELANMTPQEIVKSITRDFIGGRSHPEGDEDLKRVRLSQPPRRSILIL